PHAQSSVFLFKQPAPTELYTLSLHDALPILAGGRKPAPRRHATIFAVPTVQRPSLRFTIARDVRSLRRHNKLTGCPCRAFQPVLFVAWSPVLRTANPRLTLMVER